MLTKRHPTSSLDDAGLAVDQLQDAAPFSCSTVAPCYPTGSSFLDLYGLDADSKVRSDSLFCLHMVWVYVLILV